MLFPFFEKPKKDWGDVYEERCSGNKSKKL
jgi:hypothetical protein